VRTLEDLHFDSGFSFDKLLTLGQHARLHQILMEEQRLLPL
ncbi:33354_t:CDS:1, partial [Gigaspora margarita]